jgi:hypothetical protein
VHEIKHDGYRLIVRRDGSGRRHFGRRASPRTAWAAYPVANLPHLEIIVKNTPSFFLAIAFAPRTLLKNIA